MGVKRLVALRGDLPSGYGMGGEFQYASDLVAFIRAETGGDFHIEVACYPEVHPQARRREADLQAFAAKVRAGADSAHHAVLLQRRRLLPLRRRGAQAGPRRADRAGHHADHQLDASCCAFPTPAAPRSRAGSGCGCRASATTRASIKAFGLDVVTDLCERLRAGGAPGLHFYTMNQAVATLGVLQRLGWDG